MKKTGLLIIGVVTGAMLVSLANAGTLNLTLSGPTEDGGAYNSAGSGSPANLIPGNNTSNPQGGGFIQVVIDGSGDGLGSAVPTGTGLANPGDDTVLGTFWMGFGAFNPDGDWGTLTMTAGSIIDALDIVVRVWDTPSPDQTQTGGNSNHDGSVPAIGSFYEDVSMNIGTSGNSIYTFNVADPTGGGVNPIVTSNELVPEPASIALFALGLAIVGLRRRHVQA